MFRPLAALASISLLASPALAQTAPAPEKPRKEKKICRSSGDEMAGTRLASKRVCRTAAQWAAMDGEPAPQGGGEPDLKTRD